MMRLLRVIGVVAFLAFVFGAIKKKTTVSEIKEEKGRPEGALGQFIDLINMVNDEDDPKYTAFVAQLVDAKADVIRDARSVLARRSNASFGLRHSTLLALSALREPTALDLLVEVALNPQPLPPQPPPDRHSAHVHAGEERIQDEVLKLDALDGIIALADKHGPALDALVRVGRSGSLAVQTVAFAALAARPDWEKQLRGALDDLPPEQRHVALARYAQVGDVPQVQDPRRHLVRAEQGGPPIPALPGDEGKEPRPAPVRPKGAPRISRETRHG